MIIKRYSSNDSAVWNQFIDNSKNGIFMFNRNYMDYHSDRFKDHSLMFYDENNTLLALLPLNEQNYELVSHGGLTFGGFITNSKMKPQIMLECFEALKQYCKNNAFKSVKYKVLPHIYHNRPSEEDLYALYVHQAKLLKIEPSSTIDLKQQIKYSKGRKAQISRAMKNGVVVEESLEFNDFVNLLNNVLMEHHSVKAVHTADELTLLHTRFPHNIKLYVSKLNGQIIAGTLLFTYKNVVHTQYLASNDISREIGGLDLLLHQVIDLYKANYRYFDFGISSENNGLILNEGLVNQKASFGGKCTCHLTFNIQTSCN